MAIADVTYHSNQGADIPVYGRGGYGPIGIVPPQVGDSEQLDFSGGEAHGAAASDPVTAVVLADLDCRVCIGVNAVATTANSRKIKANIPEMFFVPAGERLSVIGA